MPLARIQPDVAALAHEIARYKNLDTGEVTIEIPSLGMTLDQESFDQLFEIEADLKVKKAKPELPKLSQPIAPAVGPNKREKLIGQHGAKPGPTQGGPTQESMIAVLRQYGPLTRTEWLERCVSAGLPKSSANSTAYLLRDRKLVEQFDDEAAGGLTKWRAL
jgi:hypothetical protein